MADSFVEINPGLGGAKLDTIEKDGEHREVIVVSFAEWSVVGEATNAPVTVTRPGEVGKAHYVTGMFASFDSVPTTGRRLELKEGAGVKLVVFLDEFLAGVLSSPIRIVSGSDVSLTLAAGGIATIGAVTLMGWTA